MQNNSVTASSRAVLDRSSPRTTSFSSGSVKQVKKLRPEVLARWGEIDPPLQLMFSQDEDDDVNERPSHCSLVNRSFEHQRHASGNAPKNEDNYLTIRKTLSSPPSSSLPFSQRNRRFYKETVPREVQWPTPSTVTTLSESSSAVTSPLSCNKCQSNEQQCFCRPLSASNQFKKVKDSGLQPEANFSLIVENIELPFFQPRSLSFEDARSISLMDEMDTYDEELDGTREANKDYDDDHDAINDLIARTLEPLQRRNINYLTPTMQASTLIRPQAVRLQPAKSTVSGFPDVSSKSMKIPAKQNRSLSTQALPWQQISERGQCEEGSNTEEDEEEVEDFVIRHAYSARQLVVNKDGVVMSRYFNDDARFGSGTKVPNSSTTENLEINYTEQHGNKGISADVPGIKRQVVAERSAHGFVRRFKNGESNLLQAERFTSPLPFLTAKFPPSSPPSPPHLRNAQLRPCGKTSPPLKQKQPYLNNHYPPQPSSVSSILESIKLQRQKSQEQERRQEEERISRLQQSNIIPPRTTPQRLSSKQGQNYPTKETQQNTSSHNLPPMMADCVCCSTGGLGYEEQLDAFKLQASQALWARHAETDNRQVNHSMSGAMDGLARMFTGLTTSLSQSENFTDDDSTNAVTDTSVRNVQISDDDKPTSNLDPIKSYDNTSQVGQANSVPNRASWLTPLDIFPDRKHFASISTNPSFLADNDFAESENSPSGIYKVKDEVVRSENILRDDQKVPRNVDSNEDAIPLPWATVAGDYVLATTRSASSILATISPFHSSSSADIHCDNTLQLTKNKSDTFNESYAQVPGNFNSENVGYKSETTDDDNNLPLASFQSDFASDSEFSKTKNGNVEDLLPWIVPSTASSSATTRDTSDFLEFLDLSSENQDTLK